MTYDTAKQLVDAQGVLLKNQWYDEATDTFKPGGNPGGGGGGGGGDATAANQLSTLSAGSTTPTTAATKSTLIGGVYGTTLPTLTNGQQLGLQFDLRGAVRTRAHATAMTGADGLSNTLLAGLNGEGSVSGETRMTSQAPYVFNGTTWDRVRGDVFGIRTQPAQRAGTTRALLVTTTSANVIPANANSWFLANDSAADIFLNFTAAASATPGDTDGSFKLRPGERLSSKDVVDTRAINAVVASGTAQLKAHST